VRKAPVHKLLAQPNSIQHARLQDEEEAEAAPEEEEAAPEEAADAAPADDAAPAADAAAPAADAAPAAEEAKPEGVMGSVSDTMSEFAPHLDKIHWPEK
jgi:hypothetical protein